MAKDIDLKPTDSMVKAAQRGLDLRKEYGRGGTEVGIARARDIVNRKNLSPDTVKRMFSFFSRHEVNKKAKGFRKGEEGYPSNGLIAWLLWGGDPGFSWSRKKRGQLEKKAKKESFISERTKEEMQSGITIASNNVYKHMTEQEINREVLKAIDLMSPEALEKMDDQEVYDFVFGLIRGKLEIEEWSKLKKFLDGLDYNFSYSYNLLDNNKKIYTPSSLNYRHSSIHHLIVILISKVSTKQGYDNPYSTTFTLKLIQGRLVLYLPEVDEVYEFIAYNSQGRPQKIVREEYRFLPGLEDF